MPRPPSSPRLVSPSAGASQVSSLPVLEVCDRAQAYARHKRRRETVFVRPITDSNDPTTRSLSSLILSHSSAPFSHTTQMAHTALSLSPTSHSSAAAASMAPIHAGQVPIASVPLPPSLQPSLASALSSHPRFASLPEPSRLDAIAAFRLLRVPPGGVVWEDGRACPGQSAGHAHDYDHARGRGRGLGPGLGRGRGRGHEAVLDSFFVVLEGEVILEPRLRSPSSSLSPPSSPRHKLQPQPQPQHSADDTATSDSTGSGSDSGSGNSSSCDSSSRLSRPPLGPGQSFGELSLLHPHTPPWVRARARARGRAGSGSGSGSETEAGAGAGTGTGPCEASSDQSGAEVGAVVAVLAGDRYRGVAARAARARWELLAGSPQSGATAAAAAADGAGLSPLVAELASALVATPRRSNVSRACELAAVSALADDAVLLLLQHSALTPVPRVPPVSALASASAPAAATCGVTACASDEEDAGAGPIASPSTSPGPGSRSADHSSEAEEGEVVGVVLFGEVSLLSPETQTSTADHAPTKRSRMHDNALTPTPASTVRTYEPGSLFLIAPPSAVELDSKHPRLSCAPGRCLRAIEARADAAVALVPVGALEHAAEILLAAKTPPATAAAAASLGGSRLGAEAVQALLTRLRTETSLSAPFPARSASARAADSSSDLVQLPPASKPTHHQQQ